MFRATGRSHCPINYTVEVIGDRWSVIILRDMFAVGSSTFADFMAAKERIGTSVLTTRLAYLESRGVIQRSDDPHDARRSRYTVTEVGLRLVPIIWEMAKFGTISYPDADARPAHYEAEALPGTVVVDAWQAAVRAGSSFYYGPDSVVAQLGLTPAEPKLAG